MSRYFFHIGGRRPYADSTGEELADDDAAWRYAIALTRDIETAVNPGDTWRLEVVQADRLVYSLELETKAPSRPLFNNRPAAPP